MRVIDLITILDAFHPEDEVFIDQSSLGEIGYSLSEASEILEITDENDKIYIVILPEDKRVSMSVN
jgi:hypothetical protein